MKRAWMAWAVVAALLLATSARLAAEDNPSRVRLLFGPTLGVGNIFISGETFNQDMQSALGSSRSYFPVFFELGAEAEQLIQLGGSKNFNASQFSKLSMEKLL